MTENGRRQMKEPTKAELKAQLDKLKFINDKLKNAVVYVGKDEYTKNYQTKNGVTITITEEYLILMSQSSRRVFPRFNFSVGETDRTPYNMVDMYVDIMLGDQTELDESDYKIIQDTERFFYLLFDTDTHFYNSATMRFDYAFWLYKHLGLQECKVGGAFYDDLTFYLCKSLLCDLITEKDVELSVEQGNVIVKEVKDRFNAFITDTQAYLTTQNCQFNHTILIEPDNTPEAEVMAQMMKEEQINEHYRNAE